MNGLPKSKQPMYGDPHAESGLNQQLSRSRPFRDCIGITVGLGIGLLLEFLFFDGALFAALGRIMP